MPPCRERLLAEAALTQAMAGLARAQARGRRFRRIAAGFPELRVPSRRRPEPERPERDAAWWEARILEHKPRAGHARLLRSSGAAPWPSARAPTARSI